MWVSWQWVWVFGSLLVANKTLKTNTLSGKEEQMARLKIQKSASLLHMKIETQVT